MPRTLTLAFAFALASPLAAQTQLADSAGTYVGLDALSFGSDQQFSIDATVGRRYQSGLDVGLRAATSQFRGGRYRAVHVSPSVGYTRPLAAGALGRVEARAEYASVVYNSLRTSTLPDGGLQATASNLSARVVGLDLAASVSRPVRLAGSVRVHPTVGGYATAVRAFDVRLPADGFAGYGLDAGNARSAYGLGVEAALPISFRLLGADAAIVPRARFQLSGDALRVQRAAGLNPEGSVSFRLNF